MPLVSGGGGKKVDSCSCTTTSSSAPFCGVGSPSKNTSYTPQMVLAEASVGTRADRRARRGIKVDLVFFCFFPGGRKLKEKKKGKAGSEELTCTRPVWTRGGTSSPPNQSTEKGMREAGEEEEEEEEKIRADTSGVRGRTEAAWGQSRTLSLLTYFYQHTHTHTRPCVCVCVCVCVCWESIWQVDED